MANRKWESLKIKGSFKFTHMRRSHPAPAAVWEADSVESLGSAELEKGVQAYWREIENRSNDVQMLEREFPKLAGKFASRTPPHFIREDLDLVIRWKYSFDCRFGLCDKALEGLQKLGDSEISSFTRHIGVDKLDYLLPWLRGKIPGVAIAGISAILTAARPDLYAVIDDFSLRTIYVHYREPWMKTVPRDKQGRFIAEEKHYIPYVALSQACARSATAQSGRRWTPREVEMAFWGIGKELDIPLG